MTDEEILEELKNITRNRNEWKSQINNVASKLDNDTSAEVKAKALWLLGEMGLKYPAEIRAHVPVIAGFLENDDSKLRQRAVNAIGRIGRSDKNLILPYMDMLMGMKDDESGDVRHAFVWACENIAVNAAELFCEKLEIYYRMIGDSYDKVRIEAPEMFRVIGKRKPHCVKPYIEKLEWIAENDPHPVVRIHSEGAVRITNNALTGK